MNVRVKLLQTLREEMKRRGNKTRAEERCIKMFVQHHLTLDSAEHRNSRGFPFAEEQRGGLSLFRACRSVRSRATGYQRGNGRSLWLCQMPNFTSDSLPSLPSLATTAGAVFHRRFIFLPYELCFFSFLPLLFSLSFSLFHATFRGRAEFQS